MFAIVIHEKGGAERREQFEGTEISVGRVQGNDLMLPKGNVSKRHARLLYREGRFIVTDLNSTNGTYVNRRRITQATIVREGDRIYIGDFILTIEAPGGPSENSVAVPVPTLPPAVPAARPSLPTAGDSQPAASRSSASSTDDEDEATRAAQRPQHPRSNPAASEAPGASLRLASVDDESTQRLVLNAVAALVERVARTLNPAELEGEIGPELAGRIEHSARDMWSTLTADRAVATNLPVDRVLALARADLVELGPLTELLADPHVSEVAVLGHDRITVTRKGRPSLVEAGFSCDLAVRWALARLCARAGAALGDSLHVRRRLADGSLLRANLAAGPSPLVLIQRPQRLTGSLDDLVRRGTASRALATFLQQCLLARLNVLVVGPRDGGPELLLGALASSLNEKEIVYSGNFGSERAAAGDLPAIATGEAIALAARAPFVRLFADLSTRAVTASIVEAVSDGSDGVVACRHASSTRRAIQRIASDLRPRYRDAALELVAGAFELIIEVARLRDERHRVLRVTEVVGVNQGELELADVFTFNIDRTASGGLIEGSFVPAATMPGIAELMRARGAPIDAALFTRPATR